MMQTFYIIVTVISLWYNAYVHYVADLAVFSKLSNQIAFQAILDMPMCDYSIQCSVDIAQLKVLSKIEVNT